VYKPKYSAINVLQRMHELERLGPILVKAVCIGTAVHVVYRLSIVVRAALARISGLLFYFSVSFFSKICE